MIPIHLYVKRSKSRLTEVHGKLLTQLDGESRYLKYSSSYVDKNVMDTDGVTCSRSFTFLGVFKHAGKNAR